MHMGTIKKTVGALVVSTVAAVGFSGAAFATKNDNRYQHSAEAMRGATTVVSCDDLWNSFSTAVNDAHKADQAGKTKVRDQALRAADCIVATAKAEGCGWVAA